MARRGKHERWEMLSDFIGIETVPRSWHDPVLSGIGGFLGILFITVVAGYTLGAAAAMPVVASMGASAVLLFAVPHGPLSQPWPVFGGHVISAIIGVTAAKFIPVPLYAAPVAVGGAIFAMQLTRCVHPPGGATALTAVLASSAITSLGYTYVLTPVLVNAAGMLLIAFLFNLPFGWRRYPAGWRKARPVPCETPPTAEAAAICDLDFINAVRQLDTFIDVRDDDLIRIYQIAMSSKRSSGKAPPG